MTGATRHCTASFSNDADTASLKHKADQASSALWNYAPPDGSGPAYTNQSMLSGKSRDFVVLVDHLDKMRAATILRIDSSHGSSLTLFDYMGRPDNLTSDQIASLQKAGAMPPPEHLRLKNGHITINVPPYGLVVLLIH